MELENIPMGSNNLSFSKIIFDCSSEVLLNLAASVDVILQKPKLSRFSI